MEADRWIDRVGSQRSHLPEMAELATIEVELRSLLKALQEAQAAQAPVRTAYEDAQSEAARLAKRAGDLERTLSASTANARELTALQNELDHVRELLGRSEDRELELLLAVEPLDEVVSSIKAQAQPAVARRTELQGVIAELQATLDEELVSLRRARRRARGRPFARALGSLRRGPRARRHVGCRTGRRGAMRRMPDRPVAARRRPVEEPDGRYLHAVSRVRAPAAAVIVLIRHGQTTTNAQRLLVGRSDPALTELGERQARALRPLLENVSVVWSSPLQRARTTAALALPHLDAVVKESFIEVDYGTLDGQPLSAVSAEEWRRFEHDHTMAFGGGRVTVRARPTSARRARRAARRFHQPAAQSQ